MSGNLILVVEDDADIRDTIANILTMEGYQVATASHGLEALAFLESANPLPKLILLDLMMPKMSGREFRDRQGRDARMAAVPVVLLSGDSRIAERREALDAAGYLAKPVSLSGLLELVRRFC